MKNKFLWLSLALFSATLIAAQAQEALQPQPTQARAGHLVASILAHENYEHLPYDSKLSSAIFDNYLKSLDNQRSIFLQSDIDEFEVARSVLGNAILREDLRLPYAMFNVRQQRLTAHLTYARSLLKQGFDFGAQESYQLDRKNAAWPKSVEEIHDLWRKRIKNDWLRLKLAGKDDKAIIETLDKRYDNSLKSVAKAKSDDVFQIFMDAYATANDPHTNYFGVRASEEFDISMSLSLVGIGAELQNRDDYITIMHLLPGSPSELSGKLKAGDRILGVGQGVTGPLSDVIGARVDDAVKLIRGAEDSVVRLDILPAEAGPDGAHALVSLVRKKISLEKQAAKKSIVDVPDGTGTQRVGVIALPAFYRDFVAQQSGSTDFKSAARDVAHILDEFKAEHVDAVLIDLRNNGGGSVDEAVDLTGLFVDQGPVVQMLDSKNQVAIKGINPGGSAAWTGPLGVLINHASASASEIFAAAIQDYGRGIVIGETSFGKGTTQNIVNLDRIVKNDKPAFGELKMTNSTWFRASGDGIQLRGVEPDITLPMLTDAESFGESSYDNALPWNHIAGADYKPVGDLSAIVPTLITLHNERISKAKAFQELDADIAEFRALRKKNLISLNEAERRAERDAQEAKIKLREQETASAKGPDAIAAPPHQDDGLQSDERKIVADSDLEKKNETDRDILLNEAARILEDEVRLLKTGSQDH